MSSSLEIFSQILVLRSSMDCVFLVSACGGTLFFLLRILFMIFGGLFDSESHSHEYGHDDFGPSFDFLTIHSLTGFLMVFGFVGLGLRNQCDHSFNLALCIAFAAGLIMMVIIAAIFYGASHLTSRGCVFSVQQTIGLPAVVYLRISPETEGKIQIQIRGVARELGARAEDPDQIIESFIHVKIVAVVDESTVVVTPIKK